MEEILEYKKLLRLREKTRSQLASASSDEEKEELCAQIADINDLIEKMENENESIRHYFHLQEYTKENSNTEETNYNGSSNNYVYRQNITNGSSCLKKIIIFVVSFICVFFVFCIIATFSTYKSDNDIDDEDKEITSEQVEKKRVDDSIAQAKQQLSEENRIAQTKNSIKVTLFKLDCPNSAGGCSLHASFINKSSRVINYIDFHCHCINAVGDAVSCEVRGNDLFGGKFTGPLKPGRNSGVRYWDCIIYNPSAKKAILDDVIITYKDGTTLKIEGDDLKYIN